MKMEILRGDIFFVESDGWCTDNKHHRPAVIVSNNSGNHFSDWVEVVFLTSAEKKPLPTHTNVVCRGSIATVLCESIATVHKTKIGEYIRTCTDEEMQKIDDALRCSLGLDKDQKEQEWHPEETTYSKASKEAVEFQNKLIQLQTERDLYKHLYERTFEKMCG